MHLSIAYSSYFTAINLMWQLVLLLLNQLIKALKEKKMLNFAATYKSIATASVATY